MGQLITNYFIQYTEYAVTNIPEIFLALICLINLIVISMSYFRSSSIWPLKYKFFSLRLLQFNIEALVIVLLLYIWHIWIDTTWIINPFLAVDLYVTFFKMLIIGTTIFVLRNSHKYILYHLNPVTEYSFMMTAACFFLVLLVSSTSLIFMLICVLGFSLSLYILVMYDIPYKKSLEATSKYFYLSTLSAAFILSGTFMVYTCVHTNVFCNISCILFERANQNAWLDLAFINVGITTVLFGLFFKLAAFPCQIWAPEIYEGSPNAVMAFFVLPVKIATLAIFIKLFTSVFKDLYYLWNYVVWYSSWSSMIFGCVGAYNEDSIKKFIAYSSINQIGFLLIGIVCGTFEGIQATIIYLLIYIAMNMCFLQFYLNTFYVEQSKNIEYLTELKHFSKNNWQISIGIVIIFFTMAGIPPLAGFFGKYFLFLSAFESENYALVVVGMITSLISTYYYLRVIKILWFEDSPFDYIRRWKESRLKSQLNTNELTLFYTLIIFLTVFLFFAKFLFYLTEIIVFSC